MTTDQYLAALTELGVERGQLGTGFIASAHTAERRGKSPWPPGPTAADERRWSFESKLDKCKTGSSDSGRKA